MLVAHTTLWCARNIVVSHWLFEMRQGTCGVAGHDLAAHGLPCGEATDPQTRPQGTQRHPACGRVPAPLTRPCGPLLRSGGNDPFGKAGKMAKDVCRNPRIPAMQAVGPGIVPDGKQDVLDRGGKRDQLDALRCSRRALPTGPAALSGHHGRNRRSRISVQVGFGRQGHADKATPIGHTRNKSQTQQSALDPRRAQWAWRAIAARLSARAAKALSGRVRSTHPGCA